MTGMVAALFAARRSGALPDSAAALPPTLPAPTLDEKILREQVAAVFVNLRQGTCSDRFVALGFASFMYWQLDEPLVLVWLALHLSPTVQLLRLTANFKALPESAGSTVWAARYSRAIFVSSLTWGLAPLMFLPAGNLALTALVVTAITGICTSSAVLVAPLRSALYCGVIPMMAGLTLGLAFNGDSVSLLLSSWTAIYLLIILKYASQLHHLLTQSLVNRFEKEALASQLGAQMAATERISEEKTRFMAAASHDLRQPLHAIALFGAVLERDPHGPENGQYAAHLMRAVNALGMSLDSMLDVSSLDAGMVTPVPQALPLNHLFQSLNHVFSVAASEKELQLRLRASPLWVRSDPQLLQRLLANLVENALKYTPAGGALVVARLRGDEVWIDVRDTGIGMAPGQLERIFEEFYQIDNPGRDRLQGVGIGLSIVQRLSRLLGHAVHVRSRPGRGSCFRVVLPLAHAADAAQGWAPESSGRFLLTARGLPRRILIVDDEVDIREGMVALLRSYSVEATAVGDEGAAANSLAEAIKAGIPFDALLCDYRLAGGADGLEAGRRLQVRFGPGLPLLLITGETAPGRLRRLRDSAVPVLFKPVGAKAMLQALSDLHEAQSMAPTAAQTVPQP